MNAYNDCKRCNGNGTILNNSGEAERCIDCDAREFIENTEKNMPFDVLFLVKDWNAETPQKLMFNFLRPDPAGGRLWHILKLEKGLKRIDDSGWIWKAPNVFAEFNSSRI